MSPAVFGVLFERAPTPFLLIRVLQSHPGPVFTIAAVNDAYLLATGRSREQMVGRPWLDCFADDSSLRRAVSTLSPDRTPHGAFWNALNTPIAGDDNRVEYILHSLEAISREREPSELDTFLISLDSATRSLADPEQIVRTASKMLGEHLQADRCAYCTFEADQETFEIETEYLRPGICDLKGRFRLSQFGSEAAQCLLAGRPYVINDTESNSIPAGVRDTYRKVSVRAFAVMPLHKEGRLLAIMGLHQQMPRNWLQQEVELVTLVANRCWESIQRVNVTRALQINDQRLRLSQRTGRIGSFEWLPKEQRIIWTPELEALFGLQEGTLKGSPDELRGRVVAEDLEQVGRVIADHIARRQPECSYECRAILPDGKLRWLGGHALFFYDESGAIDRISGVNIDIDAHKQTEAHLRESEQRLRAIFDGTYEYICLLAPDGTVLEANRASLEFGGSVLSDVLGRQLWDTPWFSHTPQASKTIRDAVQRTAAGEFVRFEAGLNRPSGECLTFDISVHPIFNDDGEVVLIVPEGRDITDRKQAEERLHQQWLTFDTVLSNTPDITYTFDLEGRFTYANRQLITASHRSLKDTVGKTPRELGYPPALATRIEGQIKKVIETKQNVRAETAFTLPGGEVREYEYIYAPVLAEDGEVRAIAGASRDITERRQVEERLRESEARFRQLIDSMPQLVWSSTPDGRDDLYNKQWTDYTGLSAEDAAGEGWRIIHPDDLPTARERWKHSLESGEPYEVEYRCRRFDGRYRWFLGRAKPIFDNEGRVIRWFGTCTDINEQKEGEAALRKANRELEEFSYVASHDLQEPLRMVNIYSDLILRRIKDDSAELKQYSDFVRQGVNRMDALIRGLLTYSRAAHGEDTPVGVADLSAAFNEAVAVLKNAIEGAGAVITADSLPLVRGDTDQLAHVFQNIISNALKYRRNDVVPAIHVSAKQEGIEWVISVTDNGIGFDPKFSHRIFGLFKRLHKNEYPGTGLGLAICQRIVERYGGRMWAHGTPGQGATFAFSLLPETSTTLP